jgi:hypothetical protein
MNKYVSSILCYRSQKEIFLNCLLPVLRLGVETITVPMHAPRLLTPVMLPHTQCSYETCSLVDRIINNFIMCQAIWGLWFACGAT